MGSQSDELYKKWDGWIDALGNETMNLYTQRHIFHEVREILRLNPLRLNNPMISSFGFPSGTHHRWLWLFERGIFGSE